jgi:hypothetical protein
MTDQHPKERVLHCPPSLHVLNDHGVLGFNASKLGHQTAVGLVEDAQVTDLGEVMDHVRA